MGINRWLRNSFHILRLERPIDCPWCKRQFVQRIRSKVKGHAGNSEAKQIAQVALSTHETFGGHFNHVCELVSAEMATIQRLME